MGFLELHIYFLEPPWTFQTFCVDLLNALSEVGLDFLDYLPGLLGVSMNFLDLLHGLLGVSMDFLDLLHGFLRLGLSAQTFWSLQSLWTFSRLFGVSKDSIPSEWTFGMDFLGYLLGLFGVSMDSLDFLPGFLGVSMVSWDLLHGHVSGACIMDFQQRLFGVSEDFLDLLNGLSGLSAEALGTLNRLFQISAGIFGGLDCLESLHGLSPWTF